MFRGNTRREPSPALPAAAFALLGPEMARGNRGRNPSDPQHGGSVPNGTLPTFGSERHGSDVRHRTGMSAAPTGRLNACLRAVVGGTVRAAAGETTRAGEVARAAASVTIRAAVGAAIRAAVGAAIRAAVGAAIRAAVGVTIRVAVGVAR
jgi:hypothetical protein